MKTLAYILALFALSSCSASWHLSQAKKKNPDLFTRHVQVKRDSIAISYQESLKDSLQLTVETRLKSLPLPCAEEDSQQVIEYRESISKEYETLIDTLWQQQVCLRDTLNVSDEKTGSKLALWQEGSHIYYDWKIRCECAEPTFWDLAKGYWPVLLAIACFSILLTLAYSKR
jgi:hypothetical protein